MASFFTKARASPSTTANNCCRLSSSSSTSSMASDNNKTSLTREDLLVMARNEYARQLCRFTEAQLKQHVPSCYTNSAYLQYHRKSATPALSDSSLASQSSSAS